ncbi:uncharacterized protein LOC134278927 [Saccostrea cucullata]|uniref:uncharacterized protein LOC134278927 n=1 Tax=Saccostrea cuccullata TaxID=36930 RepID=UPI002ECFF8BE
MEMHRKLLTDLNDFIIKDTDTTCHEKWKYLVSKELHKSMEKIKDRSVLIDFDDLEALGKLFPGDYRVLHNIIDKLDVRATERIQQTEELMNERYLGISAFLKQWYPDYEDSTTFFKQTLYYISFSVNLHYDDIFEENRQGSFGKLKAASSDAYSPDLFDTGYNFLISESGNIYEDRGWNREGKSGNGLDVCFLGSDTLQTKKITQAAARALEDLLTFGLFKGYFSRDFTMQFVTPGNAKRNNSFPEEHIRKRPRR